MSCHFHTGNISQQSESSYMVAMSETGNILFYVEWQQTHLIIRQAFVPKKKDEIDSWIYKYKFLHYKHSKKKGRKIHVNFIV